MHSKIGAVQLTDRGGPFKSTFLVTFTDGYFVVAVFSRNETRRSGNWIYLFPKIYADVKT